MPDPNSRTITIGRDPNNTVVLASSNVSAQHARLTITADQMVLEDLQSTNGTSVRRVENKTTRAIVSESDSIFLGSAEYTVAEILKLAEQPAAATPLATSAVHAGIPESAASPTLKTWALIAISITAVATIWLTMTPPADDAMPIATVSAPEATPESGEVEAGSQDLKNAAPAPADLESATKLSAAVDAATTPNEVEFTIEQALYVVLCREGETKTPFRVGTAFALDDSQLATSASVIRALRKLRNDGFTAPELYSPHLKRSIAIQSMDLHPRYSQATTTLDDLLKNGSEVEETLLQTLLNSSREFDVGILRVAVDLPAGFAKHDQLPRPGQKLLVAGYPFDVNDPFFDASLPIAAKRLQARAHEEQSSSENRVAVLTGQSGADQMDQTELAFIGSPILNSENQVTGIYTRSRSNSPSETGLFEGVMVQHFSEVLLNDE